MYRNKEGFTLIELVIALTLSIVIMVILLAAMRLAYKSQEKGTDRVDVTQKIRMLEDRVSWLIRGAYPFLVKKTDEQTLYFEGTSDRIGFVTSSVDSDGKGPEDIGGLKWVSVFADRQGLKVREKVYFLEDVFDDKGDKEYLLDPEVEKVEFEYYDIPEGEKKGDWVSVWDHKDKTYVPSAVKFKITLEHETPEHKKITIEMPEIVVMINAQRMPDATKPSGVQR